MAIQMGFGNVPQREMLKSMVIDQALHPALPPGRLRDVTGSW
jgi:hypothetical protein